MRVTGGKAKGTQLKILPKRSIRPTTNVARQAIFSILGNTANDWHRVLDLYAGSGALGIEALSRKAEWVDFVDHRKKCCDIIKYNLAKTGGLDRAHIYCCSVNKAITFLNHNYDIIFLDPPYSDPFINNALANLASSRLVGANSIIIVFHSHRVPLSSNYDGLYLVKQRKYGDTSISIYQKKED